MMRAGALSALLFFAVTTAAQETRLELHSTVTGNQELPRVMYIVPWRQAGDIEFNWQPEPGIAGELFQPLRRDEYLRSLDYGEMIAEGEATDTEPSLETQ